MRLLLLLFPRPFRERFGDDLLDVAADRVHAARRRSSGAAAWAWMRAAGDMAAHGIAERRASRITQRRSLMIRTVVQDVRHALRGFAHRPGFTAVALLTLALGIGANTAIFSAVHAVLLRALPYPDADEIVLVYATHRKYDFDHGVLNPAAYTYIETRNSAFDSLSVTRGGSVTLTGVGRPDRLRYSGVSAEFFSVMRTPAQLGRVFTDAEAGSEAKVVVLSHTMWTARFSQNPSVLNTTVMLDGEPWTVIGVMPAEFAYPKAVEFWRPLSLSPVERANLGSFYLGAVGRLAPGVTIENAETELDQFAAELEQAHPKNRTDRGFHIIGLRTDLGLNASEGLWLLQGVVIFVLLIACANVANLLLAQGAARQREFGVRAAVGASRGRLIAQTLTEGVTLALAGAALGALLAVWGVKALVSLAPAYLLPQPETIGVSWPVLGVTALAATITGLLFGVGPAVASSMPSLAGMMGDGTRSSAIGLGWTRRQGLRAGLVAAEVALALVLVTGAGLLIKSFSHLVNQAPGFSTEGLLTARVVLPEADYPDADTRYRFWSELESSLVQDPEVRSAAGSTALPFSLWEYSVGFDIVGLEEIPNASAGIRTVTPGFFQTLGISVRTGRTFTSDDTPSSEGVAIVSDAFTSKYFPDREPLGQQLKIGKGDPVTIVGIVAATRHYGLDEELRADIYRPLAQDPDKDTFFLAVKTTGEPAAFGDSLRVLVAAIDPALPVSDLTSMKSLVANSTAKRRFYMTLLTLFSGLAIMLAVTGVFGVMSYVVTHGRREIAIRLALGARPAQVRAGVVRQGLSVVAVGAIAGVLGARGLSTLVETQLFEVPATDAATYLSAAVLLLAVSTLACWLPTARASAVNPVEALRD